MAVYTPEVIPEYEEEWRPVPTRAGLLASSWGRILLPSTSRPGLNGGLIVTKPQPRWGVVKKSRAGGQHVYLGVQTRMYGNLKVHQCVCEAWHGPRPHPGALVLHLDENGLNNLPWNLRWGTHEENMNFPAYKERLRAKMLGNNLWQQRRFPLACGQEAAIMATAPAPE